MRFPLRTFLIPLIACVMTFPPLLATNSSTHPAAAAAAVVYPSTARDSVVEQHFGVPVPDPFRWLENDVREDTRVREWVTAQNRVTDAYLAALPARAIFSERLRELYDYERYGIPVKKGGRYFYTRNDGLQNQAVLYVRDRIDGPPRLLIDPNTWSEDGATALSQWAVAEDGRHIAYGIQDGGSDWRTVRVLNVDTGAVLADEVRWIKYSSLQWAKDGTGFFYSRFPEPLPGQEFQSLTENHAVCFHRLGTPQSEDRTMFSRPEAPRLSNRAEVSDDGRWLITYSSEGTDARYDVSLVDLRAPAAEPIRLVEGRMHDWDYIGNDGDIFYWRTNLDAPRLRIVATDIHRPAEVRERVPEDQATLAAASIVGETLIVRYLVDAKTEVRTFRLDGHPLGSVSLPGIGTAGGFYGERGDVETFYSFTSYNRPTALYHYDLATGTSRIWEAPRIAFDPEDFVVTQRFYASKDGTRVPMFLVHRKDLDLSRPAPTLLYGYGGFNISLTPGYAPARLAWLEQGGVYAVANLRGGGEYGKAWHDAGRLGNKQNVFDDFIAAAEFLIAEGITTSAKLAIQGGSNGGLLVGAVINQRPELFAAGLPAVGVMDMLRFNRWTAGRYWVDDYGHPDREADFRALHAYSPYHNIRAGRNHPAILVTTADTDDRVVPGHSFKYAAALQAADLGPRPRLIRIETRAGHGSGKPTDKIIEEYADLWAFIAHWTGMEVSGR